MELIRGYRPPYRLSRSALDQLSPFVILLRSCSCSSIYISCYERLDQGGSVQPPNQRGLIWYGALICKVRRRFGGAPWHDQSINQSKGGLINICTCNTITQGIKISIKAIIYVQQLFIHFCAHMIIYCVLHL